MTGSQAAPTAAWAARIPKRRMAGTPTSSPGSTNELNGELPSPGLVETTWLGASDAPGTPTPPTGPPPGPWPDGKPELNGPPPPRNGELVVDADGGAPVGSGRLGDGIAIVGVGIGRDGGGGSVGVGTGRDGGGGRVGNGGSVGIGTGRLGIGIGRLGNATGRGSGPATVRARTSSAPMSVVVRANDWGEDRLALLRRRDEGDPELPLG